MMEQVSIVAFHKGRMSQITIDVVRAHITIKSLAPLCLTGPKGLQDLKGKAVTIEKQLCVTLDAAQAWLEKNAAFDISSHLVEKVRIQAPSVRAEAELAAQQNAARSAEVVLVGQELNGVDHFRRAVSEVPEHLRLAPHLIAYAAERGVMIGYEEMRDFWDDNAKPELVEVKVLLTTADGKPKPTFDVQAFKKKHAARGIMTGPEAMKRHPGHWLFDQPEVPAYVAAVPIDDRGNAVNRVVLPHPRPLPWEPPDLKYGETV